MVKFLQFLRDVIAIPANLRRMADAAEDLQRRWGSSPTDPRNGRFTVIR